MKLKKTLLLSVSSIISLTLVILPLTPVFDSIFSSTIDGFKFMKANIEEYRKESEQLKYISERSLSLKFRFTSTSNGSQTLTDVYGTGWIIGKSNSNNHTYYVATNMHVAGSLSLSSYSYKDYKVVNNSWNYTLQSMQTFLGLDVGIVGSGKIVSGTVPELTNFGTSKPSLLKTDNEFYDGLLAYINTPNGDGQPFLKSDDIKIVYSGYQSFDNQLYSDVSNSNLRFSETYNPNNYLYNPTSDIAILSIDFSPFYEAGSGGNAIFINNLAIFKEFLDNYDLNPTKFASEFVPGEDIFVGGFPAASTTSGSVSPRWSGVSYVKTEKSLRNGYEDSLVTQPKDSNGKNVPMPEFSAANNDEIKYYGTMNGKDFFSFRNSATQAVAWGVDLKGGSSGSLAINSKNEVIGIYWGGLTYSMNNSSKDYFSGRIDLLNGNGTGSTNRYKYNILEDISEIIKV